MRKNDILGVSVVALGLSFLSMAHAQTSDVVVDLSVLDSLSPSSVSEVAAQPLFPVVSKSEAKPVVKKAPARKKAKVARKAAKVKPAAKIVPAVKVEAKAEEPQVVAAPAPVVPENIEPKESAVAEVAVAPIENTASAVIAPVTNEVPVVAAPINNEVPVASEPAKNEIRQVTEEEHIVVVDVEPVSPKTVAAPAEIKMVEPVVEQTEPEVAEPEALKPADVPEKVSNALSFESDVSDLTSQQQQQIDTIISSFDNPQQNKIAIFAYNLDDGVDTFKRKRLSLNRAVDVRSYLLQKGYKNFSIKVINVDSGSDKVNSVEIVEIK